MHKKIFSMHGFFYTSFKKVEYFSKKFKTLNKKKNIVTQSPFSQPILQTFNYFCLRHIKCA